MKINEIRNLSHEEILEKVKTQKRELMLKRFQSKTGKLENRSEIKKIRREIARLLTVANEMKTEVKS